jgi:hypothetical protein
LCANGWRHVTAAALVAVSLSACGGERETRQPADAQARLVVGTPGDVLRLPKKPGSVRFAAIGDAGRGDQAQYEVSAQMQAYRKVFPFDFVLMLGDNVYDGGTPEDYRLKFELPYKPFLDADVPFFATIGNHDDPDQPAYAPFHMGGERYYTFKPPSVAARLTGTDVRFFMIDTERLDRTELEWIDREMAGSNAEWKIPVFHRPIYTSGRYARPARMLRAALEPLFVAHGVAVAFSGHEHFYERTKPQQGVTYFISGGAGSLRFGDIRQTELTEAGFDRDFHFMLIEISGDELYFQAISRTGASIDTGVIRRDRRR